MASHFSRRDADGQFEPGCGPSTEHRVRSQANLISRRTCAAALAMLGLSIAAPAQSSPQTGGAPHFSLAFDWGAVIESDTGRYNGAPLFLGLTASYWTTDWFLLDASANYLLSSK